MSLVFLAPAPTTTREVSQLEARIQLVLPHAYVEMLTQTSNGGAVEPISPRASPEVGVVAFFGVGRSDDLDIEARLQEYRTGSLPEGFLPIADAEGGNLISLSMRSVDFGSVWFWDHELEDSEESHIPLAATFEQFIDDLVPASDPTRLPRPTEAWIDPDFLLAVEGGRNEDLEAD